MRGTTARTVMMVLMLAGIALALSAQGAAARHASAPVTVIVNPDRWINADELPVQRVFKAQGGHRFAGHRVHRSGSRTFHPVQRHGRHAFRGFKKHATGTRAVRAFQRGAAHHAGFHSGSERGFHKPAFHASEGDGFKRHRLHSFKRSGMQRFEGQGAEGQGVIVFRGSGFHSFKGGQAQAAPGAKLILLPSSPHFKHIVVVPSHHPVVD